jgi:hypothetical protein
VPVAVQRCPPDRRRIALTMAPIDLRIVTVATSGGANIDVGRYLTTVKLSDRGTERCFERFVAVIVSV